VDNCESRREGRHREEVEALSDGPDGPVIPWDQHVLASRRESSLRTSRRSMRRRRAFDQASEPAARLATTSRLNRNKSSATNVGEIEHPFSPDQKLRDLAMRNGDEDFDSLQLLRSGGALPTASPPGEFNPPTSRPGKDSVGLNRARVGQTLKTAASFTFLGSGFAVSLLWAGFLVWLLIKLVVGVVF
jgi:hypothetical protein